MARYIFNIMGGVLSLFLVLFSTGAKAQQQDSVLVTYTVQRGDNLYRISLQYKVTVQQIMDWNGIENADEIKVGQRLKLWFAKVNPGQPNNQPSTDKPNQNPPETQKPKESGWVLDNDTAVAPPTEPEKKQLNKETIVRHPFNKDDSLKKLRDGDEFIFRGTRIAPKEEEFDTTGMLDISGYISAYYAYYTDSVGPDGTQKFPTLNPHSNEVGLNLVQISARYTSEKVRGIVTLHWGDMPDVCWSTKYNLIQQANIGVRIVPKLWFDVGYFRTHIGLESVQPRENINSTIAVTTFVEPYYLSGAKLTWQASKYVTLQANAFNQFNGYVENNNNKAIGFSAMIDPSSNLSMTLNTITSNDEPEAAAVKKQRWYNDFYLSWRTKRTVLGFEFNYGTQKNSKLDDTAGTATMMSTLLAFKYSPLKKFAVYARGEYCKDPNGFLSGTYTNSVGKAQGIDIWGITGGVELKPIPNSYVRFEYRRLNQNNADGNIFYYNGQFRTYRNEFVFSTGFWF
jgi:murein DD-endopeptidase MepM/ murein hydrolase activator NlpD